MRYTNGENESGEMRIYIYIYKNGLNGLETSRICSLW